MPRPRFHSTVWLLLPPSQSTSLPPGPLTILIHFLLIFNQPKPVFNKPKSTPTSTNLGSKQLASAVTYPAFSLAIPPTREALFMYRQLDLPTGQKQKVLKFLFPLPHLPLFECLVCKRYVSDWFVAMESGKKPVCVAVLGSLGGMCVHT